jgi:hypothetical protein
MGWGLYEATTEIFNFEHEFAFVLSIYVIVGFQKVMYE